MSSKVIHVINKIIARPENIEQVFGGSSEYYFRYKGHFFSILQRTDADERFGRYSFYVYPKWTGTLEALDEFFNFHTSDELAMAAYHETQFSDAEKRLLPTLYSLLQQKELGLDEVFDDILGDTESN